MSKAIGVSRIYALCEVSKNTDLSHQGNGFGSGIEQGLFNNQISKVIYGVDI